MSKIIVIGEKSCGKTSYIKRLITGDYPLNYEPTHAVEVYDFKHKNRQYKLWDCAGDESGLGTGYWVGAKAAILCFEDPATIPLYLERILECCQNIPIVTICMKCDDEIKGKYLCTSARYCQNLYKPFDILDSVL